MAGMKCLYGMELSNHEAPNDVELVVYTDKEWEKICDCESIEPWNIPLQRYNVYGYIKW